jgi:predicted MFS family arabinose efflux permease
VPDSSIEEIPAATRFEELAALVVLGVIATAGMFSANIMPVLVSALREGLHYSSRDAGLIGAADVYGAAFGCALAALLIRKMPWRVTAAAMLAAMIVLDGLSTQLGDFRNLLPLRLLHGLIGGVSVGIGFSVIGRTPSPDRGFGVLMLIQFWLAGSAVMLLPRLAAQMGPSAVFLALAGLSLLALVLLPLVPDYPERPAPALAPSAGARWNAPLLLGLLGLFLFQATKMSLYAYLFGFGRSLQLSTAFLSTVIGASAWLGSLGSLAVVALGLRYGRLRPLIVTIALAIAAYLSFLLCDGNPILFGMAEIGMAVVWAFVAPYLFGLCSAFDGEGRMAAWSSFFSKLGMATGPALGGVVLAETHYERLLYLAIAGIIGSGLCVARPARLLDRLRTAPA